MKGGKKNPKTTTTTTNNQNIINNCKKQRQKCLALWTLLSRKIDGKTGEYRKKQQQNKTKTISLQYANWVCAKGNQIWLNIQWSRLFGTRENNCKTSCSISCCRRDLDTLDLWIELQRTQYRKEDGTFQHAVSWGHIICQPWTANPGEGGGREGRDQDESMH